MDNLNDMLNICFVPDSSNPNDCDKGMFIINGLENINVEKIYSYLKEAESLHYDYYQIDSWSLDTLINMVNEDEEIPLKLIPINRKYDSSYIVNSNISRIINVTYCSKRWEFDN